MTSPFDFQRILGGLEILGAALREVGCSVWGGVCPVRVAEVIQAELGSGGRLPWSVREFLLGFGSLRFSFEFDPPPGFDLRPTKPVESPFAEVDVRLANHLPEPFTKVDEFVPTESSLRLAPDPMADLGLLFLQHMAADESGLYRAFNFGLKGVAGVPSIGLHLQDPTIKPYLFDVGDGWPLFVDGRHTIEPVLTVDWAPDHGPSDQPREFRVLAANIHEFLELYVATGLMAFWVYPAPWRNLDDLSQPIWTEMPEPMKPLVREWHEFLGVRTELEEFFPGLP